MNRHVNAISGRLSLRSPQRRPLEILHRITEIAPAGKDADTTAQLAAIQSEFSSVKDFEREFPSLCFGLATGVEKTWLMDEFYRYRASAGVRAINELKPILGLELTATPFVENNRGAAPFKNVIYDYPLGKPWQIAPGWTKGKDRLSRT